MSALDSSVVNVILPLLKSELHSSIDRVAWVPSVYLLVVSALLLLFGRLGDLNGHKRVYLAGFGVFLAGSLLCAAARSDVALIASRAVQAVGAAMLFANSPAVLTQTYSSARRGRVLGMQGMMTYLGLAVGPSLGGWLAHIAGWRAVFLVNIPFCLLAAGLVLRHVADDHGMPRRERFDTVGAMLFASGLAGLMLVLNQGASWGWTSTPVVGLSFSSALAVAAFVRWERSNPAPMLSLRMFQNRVFSVSTVSALLNYSCVFSLMFSLPFLLIQGKGMGAREAGVVLTIQPVLMAIVAPLSGALSDRSDPRRLAAVGMALLAAGLASVGLSAHAAGMLGISSGLALVGIGVGLFVSPNNSALMGSASRERQGTAAAVLATSRNVGMVVGIGLSVAVLSSVQARAGHTPASLFDGVRASLLLASAIAAAGTLLSLIPQERQARIARG